jgi:hypothetical protein
MLTMDRIHVVRHKVLVERQGEGHVAEQLGRTHRASRLNAAWLERALELTHHKRLIVSLR